MSVVGGACPIATRASCMLSGGKGGAGRNEPGAVTLELEVAYNHICSQ